MMIPMPLTTDAMKPRREWFFEDGIVTNIFHMDWAVSADHLVLPKDTPPDIVPMLQWAYEFGHAHGNRRGSDEIRNSIKSILDIPR